MFSDFDCDGDLDLIVLNGGAATELYVNNGTGGLSRVKTAGGPGDPASTADSFGAAWGDFDGDGDLDLIVAIYGGAIELYENDGAAAERPLGW